MQQPLFARAELSRRVTALNVVLIASFLMALAAPLRAQNPPVAPAAVGGVPAPPTAETIRQSDFIAAGRASVRSTPAETTVRFGITGLEVLKGPRDNFVWLGSGFVFPGAPPFANNEKVILFGRWDSEKRRLIPLEATPFLPSTPENLTLVRKLVEENPTARITMDADKERYNAGESIVLRWTVENLSPAPITIYTGPYAVQYDVIYDNTAHGTGTGGSGARKPEEFPVLQPGEKWHTERTLKGPFPEGATGLRMRYDSQSKDVIGSGAAARVLKLHELREFSVQMAPLDEAAIATLLKQLKSPLWDEQMAAMHVLASSNKGAQRPEVRGMAQHPWPALRVQAARALTQNGAWSPELRALLFDPHRQVRYLVRELIRQRQIPDSSLSLLALRRAESEAVKAGVLDEKQANSLASTTLTRLRDLRIGDALVAHLTDWPEGVYTLNQFAGLARENRITLGQPATDEQKQKTLAAWQEARKAVANPYSALQLDAEIAAAKKGAFADLQFTPNFSAVRAGLMELSKGGSPWGPEKEAKVKELAALDKSAARDALPLLNNYWAPGAAMETPAALRWLAADAQAAPPGAFEYLLSRLYDGTQKDSDFFAALDLRYEAALGIARLDAARAKPHLEQLFAAGEFGAAVALAALGEKKAVPLIMEKAANMSLRSYDDVLAALAKATGKEFPRYFEWTKWWQAEGKNMQW